MILPVVMFLWMAVALLHGQEQSDGRSSETERIVDSVLRNLPELFDGVPPTDTSRPRPNWYLHSPLSAIPGSIAGGLPLTIDMAPPMTDLLRPTDVRTLPGYNRADGFVLGIGTTHPVPLTDNPRLLGGGGIAYAFGSHYWQGRAELAIELGDPHTTPLRFTLEGHHVTDTRDSWRSHDFENSLAAAIAGIDHRDYFRRSGFSLGGRWFVGASSTLMVEYLHDEHRSMEGSAAWSLFGPDNPFSSVRSITEGMEQTVRVGVLLDHLGPYDLQLHRPGTARRVATRWGVAASVEIGEMAEKRFVHMVADGQLRTGIIGRRLRLGLHLRAGTASDNAPLQKLFSIGGIGALPAWPYRFEAGRRMVLLESDILFTFCPDCSSSLLREATLVLSNDIGGAWNASPDTPVWPPLIGTLLYGPAIYIGTFNGDIRIGYALRTDGGGGGRWVVRLR